MSADNSVLPEHSPKEPIRTLAFTEILMQAGCELSNRDSIRVINRCLRRGGYSGLKLSTYNDFCCRSGKEISQYIEKQSGIILQENGFSAQTGRVEDESGVPCKAREGAQRGISSEKIQEAVSQINAVRENADEQVRNIPWVLELAEETTYASIDDVGVKHQKEKRKGEREKQNRYVQNTVISIQNGEKSTILTAIGMENAFRSSLAYMLKQQMLEQKNLVIFTDGARNIQANIERIFGFRPYTIILDWYHLKKRSQEYLSMSVKGQDVRNKVLQKLLRILWVGNIDQAISYLRGLDTKHIRFDNRIDDLCGYFEKHRTHIPCYALRQRFGLRNSSNRVEKANDLVVAERQKHNGMSWSSSGSGAMAQIKSLFLNGWQEQWLFSHTLPALECSLAA